MAFLMSAVLVSELTGSVSLAGIHTWASFSQPFCCGGGSLTTSPGPLFPHPVALSLAPHLHLSLFHFFSISASCDASAALPGDSGISTSTVSPESSGFHLFRELLIK